jgi:hypothetical protein
MEDVDFSDAFCEFVQGAIPAVQAAELLLLLQGRPDYWWEPAEAAGRLRAGGLTEANAARFLDLFHARGLLATGADRRIQYQPASPELAAHVETLVQAYRERPVTLIRMIYALRDMHVRSFAEASKLKTLRRS